jgi:CRISP-associated protein Cas1
MKRLLNTLYVMTQGSYLKKEGETICVYIDHQPKLRIPAISLQSIILFGDILVTPSLFAFCAQCGISVSWLSFYGRFRGRLVGPTTGNVLLRREQYRIADDKTRSALIARNIVTAKIANCRTLLKRALRDHGDKLDSKPIEQSVTRMQSSMDRLQIATDLDIIRGIEGDASREYFSAFNALIIAQKADFSFTERNRRPPMDRVNALLSFLYTMLYHDARSALETTGLDPAVGFLHRDRPGRMSLALDLMEEFRPVIIDRLVFTLINLKQVDGKGFEIQGSGAVRFKETTMKIVLAEYQKKKQESITHPFIGEEMHYGIAIHAQALLLARLLRGDIEGYPPFFWR